MRPLSRPQRAFTATLSARRSMSRARRPANSVEPTTPVMNNTQQQRVAKVQHPEVELKRHPIGYKKGATFGRRPLGQSRQDLSSHTTTPDYNMQQLLEHRYLPLSAKLPNGPQNITLNPKGAVLNSELQDLVQGSTTAATVRPRPDLPPSFRCALDCLLPPELRRMQVLGTGATKAVAERAAYLHLLVILNEFGILEELWGTGLDEAEERAVTDSKVDIYNYAAQFGLIPRIVHTQRMMLGRKMHAVTINLPEHHISVTGRAQSMVTAEYAAVLEFKEIMAENRRRYWAASPPDPKYQFSTKNAHKFFEFLEGLGRYKPTVELVADEQDGLSIHSARLFLLTVPQGVVVNSPAVEASSAVNWQNAIDLAHLTSALTITRLNPRLKRAFFGAQEGAQPPLWLNVPPVSLPLNVGELVTMKVVLDLVAARPQSRPKTLELVRPSRGDSAFPEVSFSGDMERQNDLLVTRYARYLADPRLRYIRETRAQLPIAAQRDELIENLQSGFGCIVAGQTGSGKTTQVPQLILEAAEAGGNGVNCNIICTQPRRIAAISAARRVAYERGENIGEHVGYMVRFDKMTPRRLGSIAYCTNGVLLHKMQYDPDGTMSATSHIIIDEIHERSLELDLLLLLIKRTLRKRRSEGLPVPKIILMSATMDPLPFAEYFKEAFSNEDSANTLLPVLRSSGRSYPVRTRFLDEILEDMGAAHGEVVEDMIRREDGSRAHLAVEKAFTRVINKSRQSDEPSGQDIERQHDDAADQASLMESDERHENLVPIALVAATVAHIAVTQPEGSILVFLPGLDEIEKVANILETRPPFTLGMTKETAFELRKLHGSMSVQQQEQVFTPPLNGVRKIILATNIAETSITVPDVCYVVDTGKVREHRYNATQQLTSLNTTWISKSSKEQRAGRAGRVQPGNYYGLFSQERFDSLAQTASPEIRRVDLHATCLLAKTFAPNDSVEDFLSEAIEPPEHDAIDAAVTSLRAMEALDGLSNLTALGNVLAKLPVHPAFGKMIILGLVFRCLQPMIIIGAALHERDLLWSRVMGRDASLKVKRALLNGEKSDHLAKWAAFEHIRRHTSTPFGNMPLGITPASTFDPTMFNLPAYDSIDKAAKEIHLRLAESGLITNDPTEDAHLNENSNNTSLITALVVAGLPRKIAVHHDKAHLRSRAFENLLVHPGSLNRNFASFLNNREVQNTLVAYSTMAETGGGKDLPNKHETPRLLRDTTIITPLMAALFGGAWANGHVDGWLPLAVTPENDGEQTLTMFRAGLDDMLKGAFDELAERKPLRQNASRELFVQGIAQLFKKQGLVKVAGNQAAFAAMMKRLLTENAAKSHRGIVTQPRTEVELEREVETA